MSKPMERHFLSQQKMNQSLTANTQYQLEKAIQLRGQATLMVSGGSTPKPLYQSLSKAPLAWHKINVAMVDERWVSPLNSLSNENFIRQCLLKYNASKTSFTTMKSNAKTAQAAQAEINQKYQQLMMPFDVTILGMGKDGHIASLFPHSDGLVNAFKNKNDLCCAIQAKQSDVTGKQTERMSLTLNALKKSRLIKLIITGKEKLSTYQQALNGHDQILMPVRAIIQQTQTPVITYWAP